MAKQEAKIVQEIKGESLLKSILDIKDKQVSFKDVGEIELELFKNEENNEDRRFELNVQIFGEIYTLKHFKNRDVDTARSEFKELTQGLVSGTAKIVLERIKGAVTAQITKS